jgi:S-formylglutathione hydrolase FrmB
MNPKNLLAALLCLAITADLVAQTPGTASRSSSRPSRERRPFTGSGSVEYPEMQSKVLGKMVRYAVYLPPGYKDAASSETRYPVIHYLHGLFEGASGWMGRGGAELFDGAIKDKKIPPVIVIVPEAGWTFFLDRLDGKLPYARFFIEEWVPWVDKNYRTTGTREQRLIGGTSMGGFGALRFAMKHPDLFSAVVVHSPAIPPESPVDLSPRGQRILDMMRQQELLEQLFGDPIDMDLWNAANPLSIAKTANLAPGLAIYVDCGDEDSYGFDETCRAFNAVLTKRNIPHEFAIRPGGHGWRFVRSAFPHAAEFISKHLKAATTKQSPEPQKAGSGTATRGS